MNSKWLIAEIYKIQRNQICQTLNKPLEFETQHTYISLLKEVDQSIIAIKKGTDGHIPARSRLQKREDIKELKPLREYLKQMSKK